MSQLKKITSAFTVPALFLTLVCLIDGFGNGLLKAKGMDSGALDLLARAGTLWAGIWWLKLDSKRQNVDQVYCLGVLTIAAAPILFLYHLVRTRGALGLTIIFIFLIVVGLCNLISIVTYLSFGGPLDLLLPP